MSALLVISVLFAHLKSFSSHSAAICPSCVLVDIASGLQLRFEQVDDVEQKELALQV